jgi:hypothetical protein
MSRPFININSASHAGATLSLDYSYAKLRNYSGSATISISGFSNSVTYVETRNDSGVNYRVGGIPYEVQDVTVGSLGTNSNATYITDSSLTIVFGGTPSTGSNIKIQILGVTATPNNGITAASGVLTDYVNLVASSLSFSGAAAPFTLTYSTSGLTSSLIVKPTNTGSMYNNIAAVLTVVKGAAGSTLTYSIGTTFSGGITDYNLSLFYSQNGYTDFYTFRKTGI